MTPKQEKMLDGCTKEERKLAMIYDRYRIPTPGERWEGGASHHPKSEELYKHISMLDFVFQGDSFCFKKGGDGDNGENLMYLLDMYFELQEKK